MDTSGGRHANTCENRPQLVQSESYLWVLTVIVIVLVVAIIVICLLWLKGVTFRSNPSTSTELLEDSHRSGKEKKIERNLIE